MNLQNLKNNQCPICENDLMCFTHLSAWKCPTADCNFYISGDPNNPNPFGVGIRLRDYSSDSPF